MKIISQKFTPCRISYIELVNEEFTVQNIPTKQIGIDRSYIVEFIKTSCREKCVSYQKPVTKLNNGAIHGVSDPIPHMSLDTLGLKKFFNKQISKLQWL